MLNTKTKSLDSNKLSSYRTLHHFEQYAEVTSLDEFREYCDWAKENNTKIYVLGNGSNTLFKGRSIKTLILKNKLPKYMKPLTAEQIEVSSSVLVMDVLKYCLDKSLDSFYYLASVPATVGGALAMNAGRGRQHGCSIYDFIETITFFEGGCIKTLANHEIERSYRQTAFTGLHDRIILSAVFKFSSNVFERNPILERLKHSKEHQDNGAPNCGTVFKLAYLPILKILRGLSFGAACFSSKTANWILNRSESSLPIRMLIWAAKILHLLVFKKVELEVIVVD